MIDKGTGEPYSGFAAIYDALMAGVDYEAWADYVGELLRLYQKTPRTLVDLACGTGSSTLPFAARGYRISGVDLSGAMLELAREKATALGLKARFLRRDLRRLGLPPRFDLALLFQDGLNYLLSEEELAWALAGVYAALLPGGLFIFDLTRPRYGREGDDKVWQAELGDLELSWVSSCHAAAETWSVTLTVRPLRGEKTPCFREEHREKDHDPALVQKLLEQAGFKLLGLYPTFGFREAAPGDRKLTFVAEKGGTGGLDRPAPDG